MQSSKLSEWLNVFASAGVLIGLLLVAFEIRQNNILAEADAIDSSISGWDAVLIADYESDIGRVYIKSITEPENLTNEEIFRLNGRLSSIASQYHRLIVINERGLRPVLDQTDDPVFQLEDAFNHNINNKFGRAWYELNRGWLHPKIVEVWDRKMSEEPIPPSQEFTERIKQQLQ